MYCIYIIRSLVDPHDYIHGLYSLQWYVGIRPSMVMDSVGVGNAVVSIYLGTKVE